MIQLPHIAARLFDTPLLIDAGKLASIVSAIGGRISGADLRIDREAIEHVAFAAGRPSEQLGVVSGRHGRRLAAAGYEDRDILDMVDGVATIPIEGSLVHKGAWLGSFSGDTSYQGLQTQIATAIRSPFVKGVVFEVDSFGGEAAGAFETAHMIAQLSAAKPTLSILTDFAASSGYLLASAARQVVMPPGGAAGSIGVVSVHADFSKALEQDGVNVTLITSGEHKADGNPYQALPAAVLERLQARNDATRDRFAATVGANRGIRLTKQGALDTEAQMFTGEDAVTAGLVDGIVDSPVDAFATFVDAINRA
jgi:signal peptide peptidase SppA